MHLWFPAPDAAVGSEAVADADPAVGANTAARAEHCFPMCIYARRNITPALTAAINIRWRRHRTRCRRSVTRLRGPFQKFPIDFGGIGGAF